MSRSLTKFGKTVAIKSLKEKWEKRVQSTKVKGEKQMGGSPTVTVARLKPHQPLVFMSLPWRLLDFYVSSHYT